MSEQPPSKHDWGFDVYLANTTGDERKYLNTVAEMREHLMGCLARREILLTFQLPVMAWMAVLDEIEARRPRNYSQLLRDDTIDRMNAVIDRLHEETNFMIAYGPSGTVAARVDPDRPKNRRNVASPELSRKLREEGN